MIKSKFLILLCTVYSSIYDPWQRVANEDRVSAGAFLNEKPPSGPRLRAHSALGRWTFTTPCPIWFLTVPFPSFNGKQRQQNKAAAVRHCVSLFFFFPLLPRVTPAVDWKGYARHLLLLCDTDAIQPAKKKTVLNIFLVAVRRPSGIS